MSMYIYIGIIFLIGWFLYPIVERHYSERTANIVLLSLLFPVCVFAMGLRDTSVGVDTHDYAILFEQCNRSNWSNLIFSGGGDDRVEVGMRVLMKLCGEVSDSYFFYQTVFSFLYILLSFIFIYKYTRDVVLMIAMFLGGGLFMQPFNIARQMLAVVIVAYGIVFLTKNQWLKSFLIFLFASLFHKTGFIALILLAYYPLRNNLRLARLLPVLFLGALYFFNADLIVAIVGVVLDERYVMYVLNDFSRPNTGIILKALWLMNIILGIWKICSKNSTGIMRIISLGTLFAGGCFIMGQSINFVDRLGLYFIPCILLLYDQVELELKDVTLKKVFHLVGTLLYLGYFIYWTNINSAVEYTSIISN